MKPLMTRENDTFFPFACYAVSNYDQSQGLFMQALLQFTGLSFIWLIELEIAIGIGFMLAPTAAIYHLLKLRAPTNNNKFVYMGIPACFFLSQVCKIFFYLKDHHKWIVERQFNILLITGCNKYIASTCLLFAPPVTWGWPAYHSPKFNGYHTVILA